MNKIEKMLVVVDPTVDRDYVIDRTKQIAKATGASVHLFINNENTLGEHSYIYEGIDGAFFETQRKLFTEHFQKELAELEKELASEGIPTSSEFTENHHLAEAIIDAVNKIQPDLVLKSTHHHSAIERGLITNTDWRLIRKCSAALLLVKPNEWIADGTVVTAVDPMHVKAEQSRLDNALLDGASSIAAILNQKLLVFHSYYPFVSALFPLGGETEDYLQRVEQQHRHKVLELMRSHNIAEEALEISCGELISSLNNCLRQGNANILVLGALSRNIIERAIVGNTAEKILEDCPCDVLVLKS